MIYQPIYFVTERITDILNHDRERREILKLYSNGQIKKIRKIYKQLSNNEREEIEDMYEWYSDGRGIGFLIALRMYDQHSDDKRKKCLGNLKIYEKAIEEIYDQHMDDKRKKFRGNMKMDENMYENNIDAEVKKFLKILKFYPMDTSIRNSDLWENQHTSVWTILKHVKNYINTMLWDDRKLKSSDLHMRFRTIKIHFLELCTRVIQQNSAHPFFKLISFKMDRKEEESVLLSDNVREGILNRFYWELSNIANKSDQILDHVFNREAVANDIRSLIENIHNSTQPLPIQNTTNITITDNKNYGGQQILGNATISFDVPAKPPRIRQVSRPYSYGHVKNTDVVGFKDEIDTLFNHVMQDDETHVVGIVGMGGSGKTTLAKHIYHNPHIMTKFNRKIWVCISQSWDEARILNKIWMAVTDDPSPTEMDYDVLVVRLFELLCSWSYLVILDDIWSIDAWNAIQPILPLGSGSKVVVTTRMKDLPQCIDPNVRTVEPKQLNDSESYELLRRRVNESIPQNLLQLGMDMVKKCRGLPLAIVALAGVLMKNKTQSNWERLRHQMLNISTGSTYGVVKEILALSYNELPPHLRPCVRYLRIFPEDYEIEAKKLTQMWIAECLINTEGDPVCTAKDFLEEIVDRCIVDVAERNCMGEVKRLRIHDLIREMIIDKDKEKGIFKDSLRLVPTTTTQIFDSEGNSQVRSVIFFNHLDLDISGSILHRLVVEFRPLRVLILPHFSASKVPKEIGNLIHLRYLELGGCIDKFPTSFKNLKNLWTLDIRYIFFGNSNEWLDFEEERHLYLPQNELRHLYLPQFSKGWEKIEVNKTKLKTLWNATGWMLSEMLELSDDLQELCIRDIYSEQQLKSVFKTPCITSNNLHTFELMWRDRCVDELCDMSILDNFENLIDNFENLNMRHNRRLELCDMSILSKCKSLNKLKLCGPIGASTTFMLPPNLIKLEMEGTCLKVREVMNIINRSCPFLKILTLGKGAYDGNELICTSHSFRNLEKLILEKLYDLKLWIIEESAMPNLHHLKIEGCENVNLNPEGWARISNIPPECMDLSPKFEEKLRAYSKKQCHGSV